MPEPVPGHPLLGHGAASLGSRLFVFGGRRGGPNTFSGDPTQAGEVGDLCIFDFSTGKWEQPRRESDTWPEPRSFQAMCAAGGPEDGYIYFFGGCGVAGRINDVWRFDPRQCQWTQLHAGGSSSEAPRPRGGSGLVANSDGSRLFLFYGFSGDQQGDVAVFDIAKRSWDIFPQEAQKGDVPLPRSVFAMAPAGAALPDQVVLFGGERVASDLGHEGAGAFASDLYLLDLKEFCWSALQAEGEGPKARGWAGMAPLEPASSVKSETSMLLFGGLDSDNNRLGDAWELVLEKRAAL